ncbi:hypothetical protein ACR1PO_06380 [Chryseobacterium sp. RRHN12]|uniref:hypothetical protein n=1 Tax=Chryseobacterium sp. RRHN12 TaxID=3437884 RepID=UPI003D9AC7D7
MEKQKPFFKFQYITKENLQKEIISFLFGVFSIATGLILGLNTERCTQENKEKNQVNKLINAIKLEAKINDSIFPFYKRYSQSDTDNIKSEFNISIATETNKSEIWIKRATPDQMLQLNQYLVFVNKVNNFKEEDTEFKKEKMKGNTHYPTEYRNNFKKAFDMTLNNCQRSITSILALKQVQ